jgi:metallophosphoesterase superfamily enzyme
MVARRCFVKSARKIIMPAFGALTGGLDVQDSAIMHACDVADGETVEALVATKVGYARFALSGAAARAK